MTITSRLTTPDGRARTDRVIRLLLVAVALTAAIGWSRSYLNMLNLPGDLDPFTDASTYLAAGERLNAGHSLYGPLQADDRPVLVDPAFYYTPIRAPLVSPPTIAAIWRPFAAVPFGFEIWIAAVWAALLGAVAWTVYRTGLLGLIVVLALSEPIGNQLSIGNVTAFFPALLIVSWIHRDRPWIGAIVSLMTAIKIAPGAMYGWRRINRSRRAIAWAIGSMTVIIAGTAVVAGPGTFADYLTVAANSRPSALSLAGLTGISWLNFAVLIGGTVAAALIRNDGASFAVAVATLVAGTPAFYHASLVPLLAIVAPLSGVAGAQAFWPLRRSASVGPAGTENVTVAARSGTGS